MKFMLKVNAVQLMNMQEIVRKEGHEEMDKVTK